MKINFPLTLLAIVSVGLNVPGFQWERAPCLLKIVNFFPKLRGNVTYTSTCFLGLGWYIDVDYSINFLNLVSGNISDLHITFPVTFVVKPVVYHPPLAIELPLFFKAPSKFANFLVLYWPVVISLLSNFILLVMCVFKNFCCFCFVKPNLVLHGTIDRFIFRGFLEGFKFPF